MPPSWKRTLDDVSGDWDWPSTWEWDYPNGHNLQSHRMPLCPPGNGGLLYAAALMAASWDGERRMTCRDSAERAMASEGGGSWVRIVRKTAG